MPFMQWTEALELGIPSFDDQHKTLIALLNELYDAMRAGHGKDVVGRVIESLIEYTMTHFSDEERFLRQQGYPDYAYHKSQHVALTRQVLEARERFKQSGAGTMSVELAEFLKGWLATHIQGSDRKYSAFVAAKSSINASR